MTDITSQNIQPLVETPEPPASSHPVPLVSPSAGGETRLAVIDDDEAVNLFLTDFLSSKGFKVRSFVTAEEALEAIKSAPPRGRSGHFDLIFCDVKMPGMDGMELTRRVKTLDADLPIVLVTAYGQIGQAVDAIRTGAFDYLEKPLNFQRLEVILRNALETRRLRRENDAFRESREIRYEGVIGESPGMRAVFDLIGRLSGGESTVLIQGESGVGKELIARAIHDNSRRANRPFVSINCSAIPESLLESELFGHFKGAFTGAVATRRGLFEEANGGTLFLDEIGDMNLVLQAKLLRVLQDKMVRPVGANALKPVDVRIVSATNKNLEQEIKSQAFREDLYYRLNVIPIHIPPLRQRREDIPALAEYFFRKFAKDSGRELKGFTKAAADKLTTLQFKGNVRELQNVIERAVVLSPGPWIDIADMPINEGLSEDDVIFGLASDFPSLKDVESRYIQSIMKRYGGKKMAASKVLGMSRRTLYRKLDEMNRMTVAKN